MTSALATQTTPPEGTPRTSWMQLGVISVSEFVVWAGFGAILPYLPLFLEEQAHASMALWAVIAAMFYVGTLLFSSPLGWLSDTIGRKPVMIGGALVYTIALLLFTTTTDPYWFILFRLLEGIGTAAFGPAAQAFVADITTEDNRSKAYGFLTTAQFGGLIVGPALAAPLYALGGGGKSGFYAIFYFGAILSALVAGGHHVPGEGAGGAEDAALAAPPRARGPGGMARVTEAVPVHLHRADPRLLPHRVHQPLRDGRLGRRLEPLPRPPRRVQDVHQLHVGRVQRAHAAQLRRRDGRGPLQPLLALHHRLRAVELRLDVLRLVRPTSRRSWSSTCWRGSRSPSPTPRSRGS